MSDRPSPSPRHSEPLCDRCGYSLEGTPNAAVCPECGLDFAASRAARVGSPWQRRPSIRSWAATVGLVIFRPRWTLRTLSIDGDDAGYPLFLCNVILVPAVLSALLGVGFVIVEQPDALVVLNEMFIFPILWFVFTLFCLAVWLPATYLIFFCGRALLRRTSPGLPIVRLAGKTIAAHASCVLVPVAAVLLVGVVVLDGVWVSILLLVPCCGFAWFLLVCLLGTGCPDRTPPASEM